MENVEWSEGGKLDNFTKISRYLVSIQNFCWCRLYILWTFFWVKNSLLTKKVLHYDSSFEHILYFRYLFAVLFLVLCLIAFKLPVIVIYFDQLFLNAEISNPPQKQQLSHVTSKPSTPYFLIEDGPISSEVNEALETVSEKTILFCIVHF